MRIKGLLERQAGAHHFWVEIRTLGPSDSNSHYEMLEERKVNCQKPITYRQKFLEYQRDSRCYLSERVTDANEPLSGIFVRHLPSHQEEELQYREEEDCVCPSPF